MGCNKNVASLDFYCHFKLQMNEKFFKQPKSEQKHPVTQLQISSSYVFHSKKNPSVTDWTGTCICFHTVSLSDSPSSGMQEPFHQRRWRPKADWSSCEGALLVRICASKADLIENCCGDRQENSLHLFTHAGCKVQPLQWAVRELNERNINELLCYSCDTIIITHYRGFCFLYTMMHCLYLLV